MSCWLGDAELALVKIFFLIIVPVYIYIIVQKHDTACLASKSH